MQILERIKHLFSLTAVLVIAAHGLTRCVSYISYVSNFGLVAQSHGYISTIPFMAGASAGVLVAGLAILLWYLSGKLKARTLPYKVPLGALIVAYVMAMFMPGFLENETALALLGLLWGLASTFASTAALEFLVYEQSSVVVVIALALASLLTALMSIFVKAYPSFAGPLDIVLAFASMLLVASLRKRPWANAQVDHPAKRLGQTFGSVVTPIMAAAIFELVVGLINMFSYTGASSFQIEADSPIVGMLLTGIAVIFAVVIVRRAPQEQLVYSVVFPGVIALILLLPFFGSLLGKVASTLLYSAYMFTSLLSMYCWIEACKKYCSTIYGIAALFTIILRCCLLVGLVLGWQLGNLQNAESFMLLSLASVICIYLLGLVLVLRNMGKRFRRTSTGDSASAASLESGNMANNSNDMCLEDTALPLSRDADQVEWVSDQVESAIDPDVISYATGISMNQNIRSELEAPPVSLSISSTEGLGAQETPSRTVDSKEEELSTQQTLLSARLDELTDAYGLTNRERDVLVGLAQGNTAAAIAKDLCLSTSTVQSYTKTLYAKLGINKKQQVIDLVMKSRET